MWKYAGQCCRSVSHTMSINPESSHSNVIGTISNIILYLNWSKQKDSRRLCNTLSSSARSNVAQTRVQRGVDGSGVERVLLVKCTSTAKWRADSATHLIRKLNIRDSSGTFFFRYLYMQSDCCSTPFYTFALLHSVFRFSIAHQNCAWWQIVPNSSSL